MENKYKADKLRGYNDMKRRYEQILAQVEIHQKESRKLKMQMKDMSKNFNKEIQANKIAHVTALQQ